MKKKICKQKKIFFILSFIVAVLFLMPQFDEPVYAANSAIDAYKWNVADGSLQIKKEGWYEFTGETTVNNINVSSSGKVYIILKDVKINLGEGKERPAIDINGGSNVTILLDGSNYLHGGKYKGIGKDDGYAGIRVATDSQVTITTWDGDGTLEAVGWQGQRGAAGIGGNYGNSCGKITIGLAGEAPEYGPTIVAKGGGINEDDHHDGAAGIGGGYDGQANNGIIINCGNVTATGGNGAAGIGGGQASSAGAGGKAENIQIHGGTVTAKGGNDAPGIGGGESGDTGEGGNIDNILITGGQITATGSADGAGIGGGAGSEVGSIKIENLPKGSYINATGGAGAAGIGSANNDVENIEISLKGGEINATGGKDGAGIGGAKGKANKINITGYGKITAKGYDESAAIGAGRNAAGGDINITGDYYNGLGSQKYNTTYEKSDYALIIDAANHYKDSDNDAAVIGGADSSGGDISIKNAHITLASKPVTEGAGIGSGANSSLIPDDMGYIKIENCYIDDKTALDRYAPTIGVGRDSDLDSIEIVNSYVDGAGVGSSNLQAAIFSDPTLKISIKKSNITATANTIAGTNRVNARAAIGSGCYGRVDSIYIEESSVTAKTEGGAGIGSGGYFSDDSSGELGWKGGACCNVDIKDSNVTAEGGKGGAGIGGGWGTYAGDITISGSNVTAIAGQQEYKYYDDDGNIIWMGAAGIGGGYAESCGDITITEDSVVEASGASYSAGIGCSGSFNDRADKWDARISGNITIKDSKVTAKGGKSGAGIGTGEGGCFSVLYGNICGITIEGDSRVEAKGGEGGAGIGSGKEGEKRRGGESFPIYIDLDKTEYKENPKDAANYVVAEGGAGAAGIGSGSVRSASGKPNDAHEIKISRGYIYAKGGEEGSIKAGSGAGIGGGNGGSKLESLVVEGGIVEAHAGYAEKRKAYDIGSGGNDDDRSDYKTKVTIDRGTVWGSISNDGNQTIINGGSVNHLNEGAKNSEGSNVYQTRMKIHEAGHKPDSYTVTSCTRYNIKDLYSDKDQRIYLYLPESAEDEATAQYYSNKCGAYQYYYGTTKTDNSGWLKMDGKLYFKKTEEHSVNEEFVLELDDEEVAGTVDFELIQNSPGENCISIIEENNSAPGAWIKLKATDRVAYTINAATDSDLDNEMYWSAQGSFSESITREKEEIIDVEDITKIYDGEEVHDPQISLKSGRTKASITYKYYKEDGTYLGDGVKPENAGKYYVLVSVAADEDYANAESKKEFQIKKRKITLGITTESLEGNRVAVKVQAFNAVDADEGEYGLGYITVTINKKSGIAKTNTPHFEKEGDEWIATSYFNGIEEDVEYTVTARYAGTYNYYNASEKVPFYYQKTRQMEVNDLSAIYGDETGTLNVSLSRDNNDIQNQYTYEIISDHTDNVNDIESVKPTITLNVNGSSAEVSYKNAGYAVVKVTVTHPEYPDAVGYATITVDKAQLKVSSYARRAGSTVEEVTYGSVNNGIEYGLEYDGFINGDNESNCFQAGNLEAMPLPETASVGQHKIDILKIGGEPVKVGDEIVEDPFYCRNYELTFSQGEIEVIPANLYVNVNDAVGKYGMEEPEYSVSFGDENGNYGLMPWDSNVDVIKSIGVEGEYVKIKPGIYEDTITAEVEAGKNYNITVNNGTLTVKRGDLELEYEVPSFIYNEELTEYLTVKPVTGRYVNPADLANPGNPDQTIFYKITTDGEKSKLETTPVDAGNYMAEIIYDEDEYYNKASASDYFTIGQTEIDVETPQVPDIYMKEGLKLSDQPLPEGWSWVDGSKELAVGHVEEEAVYTFSNSNYKDKYDIIGFNVLKREAEITITEEPSKVYDGKEVSDPDVKVVSDASEIKYEYYDVTNSKALGTVAPTNAGRYTVQAYVEETDVYKAAVSEKVKFTISKRDTALRISAEEDIDGDSAKVEMTVEVIVTDGVELDEGSQIFLDISESSEGISKSLTADVKKIGSKNVAVFEFEKAAANHYEVHAVFEGTVNFNSSETVQGFDKEPGERDLDVVIEHLEYMSEDTITVPYGKAPEIMTAIPSVKGPYGNSEEDEYSFRVVSESASDTISLEETGEPDQRKVTFENAGTAVIEVKVTNEKFYSDAVKYVTVIVEKREAEVRSYAYNDGEDIRFAPLSVQYGQVGKLKYGLSYTDELGQSGEEVLAVLEAAPVNETSGVNETGWPVKIIKSGDTDAQKSVLRNYDVTEIEGKICVTPAPLKLVADDVSSAYGHEPEFSCTATGLMEWDAKNDVVETIGPDMGMEYADLAPGKHDITVKVKENPNYTITAIAGILTITKGTVDANVTAASKRYDGQPADISVNVELVVVNVNMDKMEKPSDAKLRYYAVDGEGNRTEISDAPVDAGNYVVVAYVPENKYYETSSIEETEFTISKRNVVLAISAEEPEETKAKVTVEVLGTEYIDPSENAEITLDVSEDSGAYSKVSTEKVELVDGRYIAEFEFPNAAAAHYTVKASFTETKNHNSAIKAQNFDKGLGERTVSVETEHLEYMDKDVITVPYGTEAELITAIPSVEGPYSENSKDEYFFEIISDSLSGEGKETIALTEADSDDKRNIVFKNVGIAVVEVKVTNSDFYADAVTYVTVVVEPCEAQVTSYAYVAEDDSKTLVTSVEYGQIDTLEYGLSYTDEVGSDGHEVLSEMSPVAIKNTAGVNEDGWAIGIESVVDSRNYEITYIEGLVQITPAPLKLIASDVSTVYGTEPVLEYTAEGLVSWDRETDVFETIELAEGTEFIDLKPGIYEDIITITTKENPNYNISVKKGTLTIEKADVQLTAVTESKVYDGNPVETQIAVEPVVVMTPSQLQKPEEGEVVYYEILENGEVQKLSEAPKDAGNYYAEITVAENEYYNGASTKVEFMILKATPDVETPEVSDMYITDEIVLSDAELPEGWKWIDGSQKLSVGKVNKYAVYTPEDTRNYRKVTRMIEFEVLLNPAEINIVEDPSKVYDGTAVNDPVVIKTTDAEEVIYTYYDVTNDVDMGSTAPVKAGTYTVKASVAETDMYVAAESKAVEFKIAKRDVILAITGEENIDENIAKAKITVEVLGAEGVALDEDAVITLHISEASGGSSKKLTETVTQIDGRYIAEFDFTRTAANHYDVKAIFAETDNFNSTETERAFDKEAGVRTVDVISEHMEGNSITVTYGTDPEVITAVPSAVYEGDEYSFEIVSEPMSNTISLKDADGIDQKQIIFENAGTAVIKVTVSNNAYYEDAVAYVTVVVKRVEAEITSYAYNKEDSEKTPITSVEYGKVGELITELAYEDNMSGTGDEVMSIHKVGELSEKTGVNEDGWPVSINKTGNTESWKSVLRNYEIKYNEAVVYVTPANLGIKVEDVTVPYGTPEPDEYVYSVTGLVPWDTAANMISFVGLQGEVYSQLKPGVYEDKICVNVVDNPNYIITNKSGTLTIEKLQIEINVEAESKVYDGKPANIDVTVKIVASKDSELPLPENYVITYYEVTNSRSISRLDAVPVDAGSYIAEITVAENDYYQAASQSVEFEITKADPVVDTPEVPDMEMREGLTLSEQELPHGWEWIDGSKELAVGPVSEEAEFTPEDTRNYNCVVRTIEFKVYEVEEPTDPSEPEEPTDPSEPEEPTDPSEPEDPTDPSEPEEPSEPDKPGGTDDQSVTDKSSDDSAGTGDNFNIALWMMIMLTSASICIVILNIKKRKV